jgi:hypothetical protein
LLEDGASLGVPLGWSLGLALTLGGYVPRGVGFDEVLGSSEGLDEGSELG